MLKNFLNYKSHVTRIGSNQVKQIPVSERVVIENTHEAIISSEDFEKAREVVKVTIAKRINAEGVGGKEIQASKNAHL